MPGVIFSILLLFVPTLAPATQKPKEPKDITFLDLKKLATNLAKDKEYPKFLKPTYEVKEGVLFWEIPTEEAFKGKGSPDIDALILTRLQRITNFSLYPPKGIAAKLKAQTVEKAEKKILEGYDRIRDKQLDGEKLVLHLADLDQSVNTILHEGFETYAKAQKLEVGGTYKAIGVPIKVMTNPKGGQVYCITMFQKRLMDLRGQNPAIEVMNYSISDEIQCMGWVYYVVTWEGKKVGPKRRLIQSETVTFE